MLIERCRKRKGDIPAVASWEQALLCSDSTQLTGSIVDESSSHHFSRPLFPAVHGPRPAAWMSSERHRASLLSDVTSYLACVRTRSVRGAVGNFYESAEFPQGKRRVCQVLLGRAICVFLGVAWRLSSRRLVGWWRTRRSSTASQRAQTRQHAVPNAYTITVSVIPQSNWTLFGHEAARFVSLKQRRCAGVSGEFRAVRAAGHVAPL